MLDKIKRTLGFILMHKLANRNKFKAITEFLLWQFQANMAPNRFYKKRFASKLTVLVNKGQTGMTGNLYTGLHELQDMAFLLHFLRPNDRFVDAGANVGSYTLLASGLAGCKTSSFEPVPSTFQNLINNIRINALTELVDTFNMGLAAEKGTLKFSSNSDTTNHVLTDNVSSSNVLQVPVCSLDEVLGDDCPSLIKIDVEGFETEVLNGSRAILTNPKLKAIIIELNGSGNRYGYDDMSIHTMLSTLGFQPADYDPFTRSINLKDNYGKTNTIYIRDVNFIATRTKTAKKYKVFGITM